MLKSLKLSILFTFFSLFGILGILSACNDGWGLKGEGPVVTEQRSLPEFHSLKSSVSAEIVLSQGRQKEVLIEAQQNILDNLETEVKSGRLEINFDKNVGKHEGIKIYITIPTIQEVSLSGSGSIRSENKLKGDELKVSISGSGNMDLQARYERLSSNIAGSGDIKLAGKGQFLDVEITGSGNVHAADFETEQADVRITGSGEVELDVEERLTVSITGSGELKYKGRPVVQSSTSGSGSISSID